MSNLKYLVIGGIAGSMLSFQNFYIIEYKSRAKIETLRKLKYIVNKNELSLFNNQEEENRLIPFLYYIYKDYLVTNLLVFYNSMTKEHTEKTLIIDIREFVSRKFI